MLNLNSQQQQALTLTVVMVTDNKGWSSSVSHCERAGLVFLGWGSRLVQLVSDWSQTGPTGCEDTGVATQRPTSAGSFCCRPGNHPRVGMCRSYPVREIAVLPVASQSHYSWLRWRTALILHAATAATLQHQIRKQINIELCLLIQPRK